MPGRPAPVPPRSRPPSRPALRPLSRLPRQGLTLALAGLAGWLFALAGVPLPWLLGPLLTIGLLSLAGLDLGTPPGSRQAGQVLLGAGIGLNFTPPVAAFVAENIALMLVCATASVGFGMLAGRGLRRAGRVGAATAFYASVPGGVADMVVQAERHGGDPAAVALSQSLRVLFVVTLIPPALTLAGAGGLQLTMVAPLPFDAGGFAGLIAACTAAGALAHALRITNAWILGPLAAAMLVTALGLDWSGMPGAVLNLAQVLIGATLGLRYRRDTMIALRRFLPPAILATALLIGLNLGFGALAALWAGLPVGTLLLAVSPGGMAEMAITAEVLGYGAPLVAAFHIVRVFVVILLSGLLFRHVIARTGGAN